MDDLISRQQAIDALIRIPGIGNMALDKIRELPSAQPEELDTLIKALEQEHKKMREMQKSTQPEIIYCKDCKYRGVGNYCVYGTRLAWITKSNDFCSYGERRTE